MKRQPNVSVERIGLDELGRDLKDVVFVDARSAAAPGILRREPFMCLKALSRAELPRQRALVTRRATSGEAPPQRRPRE